MTMTASADQDQKRRERLTIVAHLAGFSVGITAIVIAVTVCLAFLTDECQRGAYIPAIFVCFAER
jgi:hypothetical protein